MQKRWPGLVVPVTLVFLDPTSQQAVHCPMKAFYAAVGRRSVGCGPYLVDSREFAQFLEELTLEVCSPVREDL